MIAQTAPLYARFSPGELTFLLVVGMIVCVPTIIAVVGIVAGAWTKVHKLRLEHALKQQMIERGMAAEDIIAVMKSRRTDEGGYSPPTASEVVVEVDGEWQAALVLRREGERFYVHLVGTDMSENQWVTGDRLRFPAGAGDRCGWPAEWSFAGSPFATGNWCGQGGRSKPAPVDQEI